MILVLGYAFNTYAQDTQEVVYLENGSVIRGVIIEQVPNVSLKIRTTEGIFAYKMSEVVKITKEKRQKATSTKNRKISKGYRGMVDVGYVMEVGGFDDSRVELTTSHGYQFNSFFFLGAGLGFSYWIDSEIVSIPIFADFRFDIPTGSIGNPYFDLKFGYSPWDIQGKYGYMKGSYGNISFGTRFVLGRKIAINTSLGYQFQGVDVRTKVTSYYGSYYYTKTSPEMVGGGISIITKKEIAHGIALKIGFEF